jgi:hypothetical protein
MDSLTPAEIDAILNSGSLERFVQLIPALQEGMHQLQKQWEENEKKETPYGVPHTATVILSGYSKFGEDNSRMDPWAVRQMECFRIYAHKTVVMEGEEYFVIASHCFDECDYYRSNVRDEGVIHVVLLARRMADTEGKLYIINGSYSYLYKYCSDVNNYSIAGYPTEDDFLRKHRGLVYKSIVPFEEVIHQLALPHKGYANYADTPQFFSVADFKKDLYNIAVYPSRRA